MICLIRPPAVESFRFATTSITAPLGLAYIASAIESVGLSCCVIDAIGLAPKARTKYFKGFLVGLNSLEIVNRIPTECKLVGISVIFTHEWPIVVDLISKIRASRSDVTVVLGGEHVTAMPEFSLITSGADFIVLGEGEDTAKELFAALETSNPTEDITGIAYQNNDQIVVNPRKKRNLDIDNIERPAWHYFNLNAYFEEGFSGGMSSDSLTVPILATRGCPYQCTYCSSPTMWSPRWIPRDPIKVVDEIEYYINKYGAHNFPFQDLTAIVKKDWIVHFCNEIIKRKLNIRWLLPTGTRAEAIDFEVAKLLKDSGMVSMAYAPESGSPLTRKYIKKKMKDENLFGSIKAAVGAGLNVSIFLVIGFPHDKPEHLGENLIFIDRLFSENIQDISVGYYMALPGTELFHSLYDSGKIKIDRQYFSHILDSLSIFPSQSYSSISSFNLMLWKFRMFRRFYANSQKEKDGRKFVSHILEIIKGIGNKSHESRLQTAVLNGLQSGLTTLAVMFKPRWLSKQAEKEMFSNWDNEYRRTRIEKISLGVVEEQSVDTKHLCESNVIESLKREQSIKYSI